METGPTGPTGIELSGAKAYDPAIASTYSVGQVVTYEGGTYIVDSAPPLGTPDTSPDYTLLAAPVLQVQQVAQVLLDLLAKRESPVLLEQVVLRIQHFMLLIVLALPLLL